MTIVADDVRTSVVSAFVKEVRSCLLTSLSRTLTPRMTPSFPKIEWSSSNRRTSLSSGHNDVADALPADRPGREAPVAGSQSGVEGSPQCPEDWSGCSD